MKQGSSDGISWAFGSHLLCCCRGTWRQAEMMKRHKGPALRLRDGGEGVG